MKLRRANNSISKLLLCGGGLALTTFSLFGAGFASWDIAPKAYATLTEQADEIEEVEDFFKINDITTFSTSPYGIVDASDSEAIIRDGTISIDFSFTYKYQQLSDLGYLLSVSNGDGSISRSFSFLSKLKAADASKSGLLSCVSGTSISATSVSGSINASANEDIAVTISPYTSSADLSGTSLAHKAVVPISPSSSDKATTIDMKLIYSVNDYPSSDSDGSSTGRGYLYTAFRSAKLTFALEALKA